MPPTVFAFAPSCPLNSFSIHIHRFSHSHIVNSRVLSRFSFRKQRRCYILLSEFHQGSNPTDDYLDTLDQESRFKSFLSSTSLHQQKQSIETTTGDGSQDNSNGIPKDPWKDSNNDNRGDNHPHQILNAWLDKRGLSITNIDQDVITAFYTGKIGLDVISNYTHAQSSFIGRILMNTGNGMKRRLLADKLFLLKIAIEEGIGVAGKLSAEYKVRRDNFWKETEFVFPNLISAILADFALVYFPAPSIDLGNAAGGNNWLTKRFSKLASNLPTNIFQVDRPFTLRQRLGGFGFKASQLLLTGFSCYLISALLSNALIAVRRNLDSNYKCQPKNSAGVFQISALYGVFLGVSSGTRYQVVNGLESHIFPRLFGASPRIIEKGATFVLRYANTFEGSREWARFAQLTGMQKSVDKK